jgi:ECF sigma factor
MRPATAPHVTNQDAREQLISLVYGELRRVARRYVRYERSDRTLKSDALVHRPQREPKSKGAHT